MRTSLLLLCSMLVIGNTFGQKERIKGNKIVSTEEFTVEGFHTIEVHENFDILLDENSDNQVKIETDSNIQRVIKVTVQDSVLLITSDKDLRRAKVLNLNISHATALKKIILFNKANAKSLSPIKTSELTIELNDNAEIFLTADSNKIHCITNGKSIADLHVNAQEVSYQVNENSEIKGILTTDNLKVDLYQKGLAKLEGKVTSLLVRADNNADFYGEKLISLRTSLIAEGTSDCFLLTNEEINIEARDKTKIYLLGDPEITIRQFADEATLYKKKPDYVPGKFRLN